MEKDGFRSRQLAQLGVFERVAKERAEHGARSFVARCTQDWQAWARDGYADAFARAWASGERDPDKLATLTVQLLARRSVDAALDYRRG